MTKENVVGIFGFKVETAEEVGGYMAEAVENAAQGIFVSYDEDGDLFVRSTPMRRSDALWLVERAKQHILDNE